MIKVHRLNGSEIVVNIDLIETVEATPDTIITFTTGKKLAVLETIDQFISLALEFKRKQFY